MKLCLTTCSGLWGESLLGPQEPSSVITVGPLRRFVESLRARMILSKASAEQLNWEWTDEYEED